MIYVKAVSYALSGLVNQIKGFISLHRRQRSDIVIVALIFTKSSLGQVHSVVCYLASAAVK